MSTWVVGVPLPGWKLSAFMHDVELPSISRTLPLRSELAMTFTGDIPLLVSGPVMPRDFGPHHTQLGRFASPFRSPTSQTMRRLTPLPWWDRDALR
jgi:hypothetical protein